MDNASPLRTPIKRARGLGSSHSGTHHFWLQRLSALALIPLSIWFIVALMTELIGADRAGVAAWLQGPVTALLLASLVVALFVHARLGMQTIIEDYVHCGAKKIAALLTLNILIYGFAAASLMAIARLHFFGIH
jgi:succinate dehydrogenase / fumarate reductase, membrane anchor subunit